MTETFLGLGATAWGIIIMMAAGMLLIVSIFWLVLPFIIIAKFNAIERQASAIRQTLDLHAHEARKANRAQAQAGE